MTSSSPYWTAQRWQPRKPALLVEKAGAIHWTDPLSVSDPHGLTVAYARLFTGLGGTIATGDAATLERRASGWRVQTSDGPAEATTAVVALGFASVTLTKALGYAPPLFGKRGYHMHYGLRGNAVVNRPMLDAESGFMLAPMRHGVRLTTGGRVRQPGRAGDPGAAGARGARGPQPAAFGRSGGWHALDGGCARARRTCCRSSARRLD